MELPVWYTVDFCKLIHNTLVDWEATKHNYDNNCESTSCTKDFCKLTQDEKDYILYFCNKIKLFCECHDKNRKNINQSKYCMLCCMILTNSIVFINKVEQLKISTILMLK